MPIIAGQSFIRHSTRTPIEVQKLFRRGGTVEQPA